ncbi:fimbrial protein [Citrobacter freundii]|uniref:fimbrial protein n=1 Tax=Citrobacter freundii TaxID=546 RepID=UPI0015E9FD5E|nr:fimbrial protein [Citrobacter freundii]QMD24776.1 fimbrial protein [Citrobacter freundii]
MRHIFAIVLTPVLFLLPASVQATATLLTNCFNSAADYSVQYEYELSSTENIATYSYVTGSYISGSGPELEANCACPANTTSASTVYEYNFAGSPLTAGVSGYGVLTDALDIKVSGFNDAIDNPDGNGLTEIRITEYPTPIGNMSSQKAEQRQTEGTADVCSDETRPTDGATIKRKFRLSVIRFSLYIKKPIMGEEIINPTRVVQSYTCLYTGGGSCQNTDAQLVSNIWLSGKLTAPLSCTINAGSTIEVDLGSIVSSQFVNPGQSPGGYTLKDVNISYHCDGPAINNSDKIKLTLTADQGVVDGSQSYIAKLIGRDDLGIRMFDANNQNVALDGSVDFPVALDEQGNGTISMTAAPVSTTASRPEPGTFEGNMTVKMDLR